MKGKPDPYDDYTSSIIQSHNNENQIEDGCSDINVPVKLQKINDNFSKSKIDDILEIVLEPPNLLVVYNANGELCGNIASPYNGRMITCLNKGRRFKAQVLNVNGSVQVYCL